MEHIVLFSGSPDSLITLRKVETSFKGHTIRPVYFPLGKTNEHYQKKAVREFPQVETRPAIPGYDGQVGALLGLAAAQLVTQHIGVIWLAENEDDLLSRRAIQAPMSRFLSSLMAKNITVQTQWASQNKAEMVGQYLAAGHSPAELLKTWSCRESDSDIHCGQCPSCVNRYISFSMNGIEDRYQIYPPHSEFAGHFVGRALSAKFSTKRNRVILATLHGGGEAPQLRP